MRIIWLALRTDKLQYLGRSYHFFFLSYSHFILFLIIRANHRFTSTTDVSTLFLLCSVQQSTVNV